MYFKSFPFDVVAFLESEDVKSMTTSQVGAYWLLLAHSWQQEKPCYLPANHDKLREIARMTASEWSIDRRVLIDKFVVDGEWIYNARLLSEYNKMQKEFEELIAKTGERTLKKILSGDSRIVVENQLRVVSSNTLHDLLPPSAKTGREMQYVSQLIETQRSKSQMPSKSDLLYSNIYTTTISKEDNNSSNTIHRDAKTKKLSLAEVDVVPLLPQELNRPDVIEAWNDFAYMRRNYKELTKKGKNVPITPSIAKRLVKKLIELCTTKDERRIELPFINGSVAEQIINQSYDHYWIDFYPLKQNTQTHTNNVKRTSYEQQAGNKL